MFVFLTIILLTLPIIIFAITPIVQKLYLKNIPNASEYVRIKQSLETNNNNNNNNNGDNNNNNNLNLHRNDSIGHLELGGRETMMHSIVYHLFFMNTDTD